MFVIKRIYDEPSHSDGYRVLVDRLWPRGISKEHAKLDLWLKEIAPSDELRTWFNHDIAKWEEFRKRYRKELETKKELLNELRQLKKDHQTVTLLFGAKDEIHNQAVVLKDVLTS